MFRVAGREGRFGEKERRKEGEVSVRKTKRRGGSELFAYLGEDFSRQSLLMSRTSKEASVAEVE